MEFTHRQFKLGNDFPLMKNWGSKRGIPIGAPVYLPPVGVVVTYQGNAVCLGFMIRCDNGVVINSDFMSDPDAPLDVRNGAVEYMREILATVAKDQGYKVVIAFTSIPNHVERLKGKGFMEMDKNLVHLGRVL